MESRIKAMEQQMADADFFKSHQQAQNSLIRWEEAQEALRDKIGQWEKLIQEREEMES
jgi:hypothetical protein